MNWMIIAIFAVLIFMAAIFAALRPILRLVAQINQRRDLRVNL